MFDLAPSLLQDFNLLYEVARKAMGLFDGPEDLQKVEGLTKQRLNDFINVATDIVAEHPLCKEELANLKEAQLRNEDIGDEQDVTVYRRECGAVNVIGRLRTL